MCIVNFSFTVYLNHYFCFLIHKIINHETETIGLGGNIKQGKEIIDLEMLCKKRYLKKNIEDKIIIRDRDIK